MADAQTPAQTESPELAALKVVNALFEQRKKLVDALVPSLPEGAKGTITLTGLPVECKQSERP